MDLGVGGSNREPAQVVCNGAGLYNDCVCLTVSISFWAE